MMPRYAFKPEEIGTYSRSYDHYSELNNDSKEQDAILEIVTWAVVDNIVYEQTLSKDKQTGRPLGKKQVFKRLLEAGFKFDKIANPTAHHDDGLVASLINKFTEAGVDVYYAARDMVSGRRFKTSAARLGGVLLGAGLGAVLGMVILPGIGSPIGAIVGSAVSAVGGVPGLIGLGAMVGKWVGSKISRLFKKEKDFELSRRQSKPIEEYSGLKWEEAEMINGYLRNRERAIQSPLCKRYYSDLRRLVIKTPEAGNLELLANFLKKELELLTLQKRYNEGSAEFEREWQAVIYLLKVLAEPRIRGISKETKKELYRLCEEATFLPQRHNHLPGVSAMSYVPSHQVAINATVDRVQQAKQETSRMTKRRFSI